jgi:quinolinate synthase
VFCGVHFMAETAAILCPDKTVLLPREDVGCFMAATITAEQLRARKAELPGVPVVTYVNSTAAVKAESDICCTSANAVKVVNALPGPRVLMVPDKNLALYTARHTDKEVLTWAGCCNIHDALTAPEVLEARAAHPQAVFLAHPECRPEVLDLADAIRSTTGMLEFVREASDGEFIIGTEMGILHTLRKENPSKAFFSPSDRLLCPDMKRITLGDLISALKEKRHQISIPEDTRRRALLAVERMLAVPRD